MVLHHFTPSVLSLKLLGTNLTFSSEGLVNFPGFSNCVCVTVCMHTCVMLARTQVCTRQYTSTSLYVFLCSTIYGYNSQYAWYLCVNFLLVPQSILTSLSLIILFHNPRKTLEFTSGRKGTCQEDFSPSFLLLTLGPIPHSYFSPQVPFMGLFFFFNFYTGSFR